LSIDIIVSTLPFPVFTECRKNDELRDKFARGIDPFWIETNEIKKMIDQHRDEENERFEQREQEPTPSNSVNLQELYNLTQMIQDDIWRVVRYRPTGKIRVDRITQEINSNFLEYGIDNHASRLEVFIKSLILDDGWSPERFRGYSHLLTMIKETTGHTKLNHLQALLNKARIMIPPDISTTPIHVIEPSISKSSNPSDA